MLTKDYHDGSTLKNKELNLKTLTNLPTKPRMFQKNDLKTDKLVSFEKDFTWWVSRTINKN